MAMTHRTRHIDHAPAVLEFWFGTSDLGAALEARSWWFSKNLALDWAICRRFSASWERARRGELAAWEQTAEASLALILILDQFPRNMYRGMPESFASDALALAAAERALEKGFDRRVSEVARWFYYLPFEHAECLSAQRRSVELFAKLPDEPRHRDALDYARRHRAIIERFGRFPHRNAILGRASRSDELAFLSEPGSSF